ncbi:MAG: hypothetical protein U0I89_09105, partial [Prevotella sp.]|nr:hypothetical protein [Prevotella sp.]
CNGSTTGFGSVCGGSNPPRTTFVKRGSSSKEWLPLLRYIPPHTATPRHATYRHATPHTATPLYLHLTLIASPPFLHTSPLMCAKQN